MQKFALIFAIVVVGSTVFAGVPSVPAPAQPVPAGVPSIPAPAQPTGVPGIVDPAPRGRPAPGDESRDPAFPAKLAVTRILSKRTALVTSVELRNTSRVSPQEPSLPEDRVVGSGPYLKFVAWTSPSTCAGAKHEGYFVEATGVPGDYKLVNSTSEASVTAPCRANFIHPVATTVIVPMRVLSFSLSAPISIRFDEGVRVGDTMQSAGPRRICVRKVENSNPVQFEVYDCAQ